MAHPIQMFLIVSLPAAPVARIEVAALLP